MPQLVLRPVNYFSGKLGVFSIIAPDFRRDTAPVSMAAKPLVSSRLSYFKFETWPVSDNAVTWYKIFSAFFHSNFALSLALFCAFSYPSDERRVRPKNMTTQPESDQRNPIQMDFWATKQELRRMLQEVKEIKLIVDNRLRFLAYKSLYIRLKADLFNVGLNCENKKCDEYL